MTSVQHGMLRGMGCFVAVLFLACGAGSAPEPTHSVVLGIDPTIADLALSAVVMWEQASGGEYAPEVHLGCDGTETFCIREVPGMMQECLGPDDTGTFNGCCDSEQHEIRLSEGMALDHKISTIAHEIGHSLGLTHGKGLMNPARSDAERHMFCIDQDTAARVGGIATCYGDDIRAEALSRLDAL